MMSAAQKAPADKISIRIRPDDRKLLVILGKKLGVDTSQLFRLSIRALAIKEGVAQ